MKSDSSKAGFDLSLEVAKFGIATGILAHCDFDEGLAFLKKKTKALSPDLPEEEIQKVAATAVFSVVIYSMGVEAARGRRDETDEDSYLLQMYERAIKLSREEALEVIKLFSERSRER
jgi:hypothetical protein